MAASAADASGGEPAAEGLMFLGGSLDTIFAGSGAVCPLGVDCHADCQDDDLGAAARIHPPVSQRANPRADNR